MVIVAPQHKVNPLIQQRDVPSGRQAVRFGLAKVGDKNNFGRVHRGCGQKAQAARLDQPAQGGGASGDEVAALPMQFGLIIGDEVGAQCHQAQRNG